MTKRNCLALGLIGLAQIGLVIFYWGIISRSRERMQKQVKLQMVQRNSDWLRPQMDERQETKQSSTPSGVIPIHFEEKKDSKPKTLPPPLLENSTSLENSPANPALTGATIEGGSGTSLESPVQPLDSRTSKKSIEPPGLRQREVSKAEHIIPPPPVRPKNQEQMPIPPLKPAVDNKSHPALAIPISKMPSPSLIPPTIPDADYDFIIHRCRPDTASFAKVSRKFYSTEIYAAALRQYARDMRPGSSAGEPKAGDTVLVPPAEVLEKRYPALVNRDTIQDGAAESGPCPWKLQLRIENGRTHLTAKTDHGLQFIVTCDHVEMKRPNGQIQATGDVEIEGDEFSGRCRRLTIAWHEDYLQLHGDATVQNRRNGEVMEMNAARLRFRLRGHDAKVSGQK